MFRLRDVAPGRATPPTTHATVKVGALAPKKKSVTQPGLGDAESSDDDTALVAVAADHVSRTQVSLKADSLQLKKKLKAAEEGRLVLEKQVRVPSGKLRVRGSTNTWWPHWRCWYADGRRAGGSGRRTRSCVRRRCA